ncbi:MAG: hypothetical protein IJI98_07850 [Methanosphaera sp.]|uniref:hypothetical protein n=1 Tax=Methanosphaera sp. ISO3-F5 TaxID=1452353 RepID=UPI002B2632B9|nr:hypothetical protein [Methanosphaera sp. ISO3-F5]MBR0472588.1 hypothetical protein [Methanosphaera sp.]WQH63756.1 hypothetical protein PXD04_08635 [Methanosphaera sp. ISO3-F5]
MTKYEIDINKLNQNPNKYLKETFDLPIYDGDYQDIYQYLIGHYSKTQITLKNTENIDPDLLEIFEDAAQYNNLIKIIKE